MVVTRLLEVTTKGSEWVNAQSTTATSSIDHSTPPPTATLPPSYSTATTTSSSSSSSSSYWNYATSTVHDIASNAIGSMVSSLYGGGNCRSAPIHHNFYLPQQRLGNDTTDPSVSPPPTTASYLPSFFNFSFWNPAGNAPPSSLHPDDRSFILKSEDDGYGYEEDDILYTTPRNGAFPTPAHQNHHHHRRRSSIFAFQTNDSSPWLSNNHSSGKNAAPHSDLVWMFRNNKNPYNAVRGREAQLSSLTAVRSLVALVAATTHQNSHSTVLSEESEKSIWDGDGEHHQNTPIHVSSLSSLDVEPPPPPPYDMVHDDSLVSRSRETIRRLRPSQQPMIGVSTPSETASQLAEGTIRALRDMALEEAVELQTALRYWNYRWERPLLSWLEAGPFVWTSPYGYNHQEIGRKVSQLQAVLARRCAAVGELQQHILRAGWHRGVAQWGVLGQGGHWAPVAGFDGAMPDEENGTVTTTGTTLLSYEPFSPEVSVHKTSDSIRTILRDNTTTTHGDNESLIVGGTDQSEHDMTQNAPSRVGGLNSFMYEKQSTSHAHVFVGKKHGGGIYVDDPSFLAEWSVDAIKLIRKQLSRAGNGRVSIPFVSNWTDASNKELDIPLWASNFGMSSLSSDDDMIVPPGEQQRVTITDVPLMTAEVSAMLDIMEEVMEIQRFRRLEQLRAPSWLRSNWYVVAAVTPTAAFLVRRLMSKGYGKEFIKVVLERVLSFFRERVVDPIVAIFNEVWRGRESFSDKKARMEAIESLKKMIKSWLDDTFPEMPEEKRFAMAESMDVSMVEKKKEESMKTFYEINNVIRMSFIEMQYMKKEMMNAMHAMDEMMSANDINMNLAAITPAILLVYGSSRVFRFLFYALLKVGKSREETYASFRHILTDIERLLVMRDNPPDPSAAHFDRRNGDQLLSVVASNQPCVLCADDLGMLMLLIHECRSILYRDRRRFNEAIIRSVAEDLAELAGERGAVSVQQQLSIVTRMCRTYPFLKVVSIGHVFQYEGLRYTSQ